MPVFRSHILLLFVLEWLILAPPAAAYLDPGVGSLLFQTALAGLLGAAFMVRSYWKQLKVLIRDRLMNTHRRTE